MFFFDPMYLLFLLPGIALAAWAQWRVQSAYHVASRMRPRSGLNGAEAADEILRANHLDGVRISRSYGYLSDHYDPRQRVLRLSPDVGEGRSLAALGIAAHEAGHAIQHGRGYAPLTLRNAMVPLANFGSQASWIIMLVGFGLAAAHFFVAAKWLIYIGIGAFSMTVIFQLINLPVEFDASRRAKIALKDLGMITPEEEPYVSKVLNAAALTYVAGTLTAILTLLYFLFRSGILGGSRRS